MDFRLSFYISPSFLEFRTFVSQDFACIDSYNTIWVHAVSTAAEPELISWLSLYFEFVSQNGFSSLPTALQACMFTRL